MPPNPDSESSNNPFDFRRPVRDRERFSGDRRAQDAAADALEQLANGIPRHLFVTGPRRFGKTSLLNFVEAEAPTHRVVPVPFPLSDATLDSAQVFFGSLLEVAITKVATQFPDATEPPDVDVGLTPAQLLAAFEAVAAYATEAGAAGLVVLVSCGGPVQYSASNPATAIATDISRIRVLSAKTYLAACAGSADPFDNGRAAPP